LGNIFKICGGDKMEHGKVTCPNCKGKKEEKFEYQDFIITRKCRNCEQTGMVWWIEGIIQSHEFPHGIIVQTITKKNDPSHWVWSGNVKGTFEDDSWKEVIAKKREEDRYVNEYRIKHDEKFMCVYAI
jgi:hypothetical protein